MTSQELFLRGLLTISVIINLVLLNCLIDANVLLNWFMVKYQQAPRIKKPRSRNRLHRMMLFVLRFPFKKTAL